MTSITRFLVVLSVLSVLSLGALLIHAQELGNNKHDTVAVAESVHPKRAFFYDTFQEDRDPFVGGGWIKSDQEEYHTSTAAGNEQDATVQWSGVPHAVGGLAGERGLLLVKEAQKYGFGHPLDIDLRKSNALVVQYDVKFEKSLECGGAYVKLLRSDGGTDVDLRALKNDSPYVIMFGPDRCGSSTDKVHFIMQHLNPKTGLWEEKHLKNAPLIKNDQLTHLYTLIVRKDNTYEILIDTELARSGSILEDFLPSINPPKQIDDPTDKKPSDWVDEEFMEDLTAKKPEEWVDVKTMADPDAKQPEDWNDEEDGQWIAPEIPNPAYVGEWKPPKVKNPKYVGQWAPRKIANPDYFEDNSPVETLPAIKAIAVEIWTMQKNMFFDNFIITDDEESAKQFAQLTFAKKRDAEKAQIPKPIEPSFSDRLMEAFEQLKVVAEEYPYVVVGVVASALLTIPLTVLCVRCLFKSPSSSPSSAAASGTSKFVGDKKKDDDVESEEESASENEAEEEEEEKSKKTAAAASAASKNKKGGKGVRISDATKNDDETNTVRRRATKE